VAETKPTVGVLQKFVGIVADATEWLVGLLGDDAARRAVFSDLGMEPKEGIEVNSEDLLAQLSGDLTSVRSYAAAKVDEADAAALVSTIEAIANIVDVVASQVEAFDSGIPGERDAVESVTALLQVFAVDVIRDTHPGLYAVARATTLITDEALGVDWDRVGEFLADFFAAFLLETEDDARRASPWLALVATFVKMVLDSQLRDPEAPAPTEDDEEETFHVVYGWDPDPTLPAELQPAEAIAERTLTMMFGDRLGSKASVSMTFVPAEHGGPGLLVGVGGKAVFGSIDEDAEGPNPGVRLSVAAGTAASVFVPFRGSAEATAAFGPDALTLAAEVAGQRTRRVLGSPDETRLEVGQVLTDFAVLADRFTLRVGVRDAALIIDVSKSDSFLRDVIGSEPIRIPFDLVLGIDSENGFFIEGGTGLSATLPVNRSFAGIRVDHVALTLKFPDRSAFRLEITAGLGLSLGPFQASVDQLGYALDLDFNGGNLAIANVDSRFQYPRGVGLTLGFEKARGGGYLFLDPDKGEYAGVLQIDFGRSSLTAIGILTTKGVPGTDNWALLMIVFAKTAAPTPGMGFVLTGFGGVIGVNHAVDEEAFRNGLRTKALDDVLFPKDPVANASRILATLRSVFPATGDKAIVGIAAEFSYLATKRVVIRVGVILQFGESGPERVVILGQLKVSAPGEKNGLLTLNADLFGDVQWGEKQVRIAVDSRLYDSKIGAKGAEFVITGSLSIRVTLGRDSMFLLTAGGFRPDFEVPAELHLPAKLDRFGFKLDQGIARITLAGYFAITPCTVQLGVEVELVAKKFGFSLEVRAAIHALLDEVEGRFTVDLELSAALKRGSSTLMKIELRLTLSGPGPWTAVGSAKFKLFFFSKTISFDCAWGEQLSTVVQAVEALAALAAELAQPANWGALPAGTALVSLSADTTPGLSVIHPLAELTVQQRLLPLGMRLDRIGGNPIQGPDRLDIGAVVVGGQRTTDLRPISNEFARGQFVDLPDDAALALPSFERLQGGVVVTPAGVTGGTAREQAVVYETFYPFAEDAPPEPPPQVCTFDFAVLAAERGAVARTATPMTGTALFAAELPDIAVAVMPRRFAVADAATLAADEAGGQPLHIALERLAAAGRDGSRRVLVESHEVMA
jgi:Family of unknown function (DUF6603)